MANLALHSISIFTSKTGSILTTLALAFQCKQTRRDISRLNAAICFIILFLSGTTLYAQDEFAQSPKDDSARTEHTLTLKTQYLQIKDEFNYGLTFQGPNLGIEYALVKSLKKSMFSYTPDLTFGANFSKGVGLAWHFRPVDVYYGFKVSNDPPRPLYIGAYFATDYNWQLYPELQSGQLFWWSAFEIGPKLFYELPLDRKLIKLSFSTSLIGWTSRPTPSTETHFYSLKFSDFVNNPHSNLTFGTSNRFNHTRVEVEMKNNAAKRFSIAYAFEYFGYYEAPKISQLTHAIHLKWRLGKSDKK